ncbi:YeeE/YedE family protein [Ideonella sp. B7]|uniref:YeeE/YedE family protein n=1 Tax=Ideonella benzenivorans TaxID=2831643 RepID=UPI001CED5587|nr:YeeE/YedE family protein [Ideonella benzenivorans]MCA6216595.1 YeeE/YedE family protein [Ideonella benzenivorans]
MTDVDIARLATQVLWAAFGLALVFGFIAHRSRFCTMGAIADVSSMGDWERARMWALAAAVATLGFNGMVALGWIEARQSIYAGTRLLWLSSLVGGGLFGVGMVLASGCGSRNLVRLGGGNLKSLVVLLVMAVTSFATLKGLTAVLRVATVERLFVDLPAGQDLPSLLAQAGGASVPRTAAVLGPLVALLLGGWALWRPEGRRPAALLGGLGIGAVITAVWWVSGVLGYVPEDPQTLEPTFLATNSHRMEALSMASPLAYALDWLLFFSDQSKTLTLGIVCVAGVPLGAAASALLERSFRWEGFGGPQDLALHLVGGSLMGVGGVVAMGCTIGQGVSGLSTLSLGSGLAVAGIVAGGLLGLRYQRWRIERMG